MWGSKYLGEAEELKGAESGLAERCLFLAVTLYPVAFPYIL
jgi:hypothetical protein